MHCDQMEGIFKIAGPGEYFNAALLQELAMILRPLSIAPNCSDPLEHFLPAPEEQAHLTEVQARRADAGGGAGAADVEAPRTLPEPGPECGSVSSTRLEGRRLGPPAYGGGRSQ